MAPQAGLSRSALAGGSNVDVTIRFWNSIDRIDAAACFRGALFDCSSLMCARQAQPDGVGTGNVAEIAVVFADA